MLKSWIDETPKDQEHFLVNSRGRPWTPSGFKSSFRKAKIKAGLKGLNFHDLRGTAFTNILENGGTVEQASDVMGWTFESGKKTAESYRAKTDKSSEAAIDLMDYRQGTTENK